MRKIARQIWDFITYFLDQEDPEIALRRIRETCPKCGYRKTTSLVGGCR